MRLSLILTAALAAVALSGCDQLPRLALVPPGKAACCQCAAKPACPETAQAAAPQPVPAAKIPAAPVMAPEATVERVVVRHKTRHAVERRAHVRRETWSETYAGGPPPAPAYDGQVVVPDRRAYARIDEQETRTERYSEHQEAYGYSSGGYAQGGYAQGGYAQGGYAQGGYAQGGYAQGYGPPPAYPRGCPGACGPQPAAGRDRDGFLTWPGKLAQRP